MLILHAMLIGFMLDLLFGDPVWLHLVRAPDPAAFPADAAL